MTEPAFHQGRAAAYPLLHRGGPGAPLLLCTPKFASKSAMAFENPVLADRPLAVLGAYDMLGFDSPAEAVVDDVVRTMGWQDAPAIQVAGYSVGGFAALLYGAQLAIALPRTRVSIFAFSPMVAVWPPVAGARGPDHSAMILKARRTGRVSDTMLRYGDARPWLKAAWGASRRTLRVTVAFAANNLRDSAHARLLEGRKGITLLPMPTAQHDFYSLVRGGDDRDAIIERIRQRLEGEERRRAGAPDPLAEATRLTEAFQAATKASGGLLSLYERPKAAEAEPAAAEAKAA
jgi:hypothetical protein